MRRSFMRRSISVKKITIFFHIRGELMSVHRMIMSIFWVSCIVSLPGFAKDDGVVTTCGERLHEVLCGLFRATGDFCDKTLMICSKPVVLAGSLVRELGLLTNVYVVQNAEKHPCITGGLTLAAMILFLRTTESGRNLCARIAGLFKTDDPVSDTCGDEECYEEQEEIVTDEQVLLVEVRRTHRYF
jgi:hypothetical protein